MLAVLNHTALVDDEGSASGGVTNTGKSGEFNSVGLGGGLVQVADQADRNLFLLGPGFLGEGAVNTDSDDLGVQTGVGVKSARDVAELLGADTSESEGEEQQNGVLFAKIVAEFDVG